MQIGKGVHLFAEDIKVYIIDPKNPTRKPLEMMNRCSNVTGNRQSLHESLDFLHTTNKYIEKRIMDTFPFTISSKRIKHLGKKIYPRK